jgi:very-short-patch-repair endonuclease
LEVDGGYHREEKQQLKDLRKDVLAKKCGYTLIRFTNYDVFNNMGLIINTIKNYHPTINWSTLNARLS